MSKKRRIQQKRTNQSTPQPSVGYLLTSQAYEDLCIPGYVSLDKNPEVVAACRVIADLISSMTIHLMENKDNGDVRIRNELSRKVDIDPIPTMTRKHWMDVIVMNLLLHGRGNSVVLPHTYGGIIQSLEPIAPYRVSFVQSTGYRYIVEIDGQQFDPADLLHFVWNPNKDYPWKGTGVNVALNDVVKILAQAKHTEKAFMESKWKPSVIVKVDGLIDEFSSKEGRAKLIDEYIDTNEAGQPWVVPADAISIEQVKPLTLADLAINETVQLDKRTVAALIGVPPFVLGIGDYNQKQWNSFISSKILPIVRELEQEMTKKLILSPKWYWKFNILSLYDYDLNTIADIYCKLSDRGFVSGNETRDRIGLSPREGLDELRVLENYIPTDMSGQQKKLIQQEEE
jgi:HK97 family phage portal protein